MFWQKIGNSVSDRLFRDSVRDSVIAENQCLYISFLLFNANITINKNVLSVSLIKNLMCLC